MYTNGKEKKTGGKAKKKVEDFQCHVSGGGARCGSLLLQILSVGPGVKRLYALDTPPIKKMNILIERRFSSLWICC